MVVLESFVELVPVAAVEVRFAVVRIRLVAAVLAHSADYLAHRLASA